MDSDNVEHFLKRLTVSEDAVAYQQAEEDLRLYFSRLLSSTCPIIGMWTMHPVLPLPSPKRTLSGCEDNGRRNENSKTNGFEISSHQSVVTATDWNSGASPLESWLKQIAMPSVVPSVVEEVELPSYDALANHMEAEIKAFRNVHINMTPSPPIAYFNINADEDFAALRLEAQIHYRNVKDDYCVIPSYLASRLAEAMWKELKD
ncbi:hypothetical protein G7Y79_00010g027640 [Physcia stellaris]|nr:hypothetical protein G7Y79_00010g027640 [Physcia stellaris]